MMDKFLAFLIVLTEERTKNERDPKRIAMLENAKDGAEHLLNALAYFDAPNGLLERRFVEVVLSYHIGKLFDEDKDP